MLAISSNFEWSTAINTHVWLRALRCGQTSTFDLSDVPQHIVPHGNNRVPFQSKNDTTVTGRHLGQQQALATTSSAQGSSKDPPLYHQRPSIDGHISAPGFHTDSDVQGRPQLLICACAYEPLSVPAHSSAGICCPSTSGVRATSRLYSEPNF